MPGTTIEATRTHERPGSGMRRVEDSLRLAADQTLIPIRKRIELDLLGQADVLTANFRTALEDTYRTTLRNLMKGVGDLLNDGTAVSSESMKEGSAKTHKIKSKEPDPTGTDGRISMVVADFFIAWELFRTEAQKQINDFNSRIKMGKDVKAIGPLKNALTMLEEFTGHPLVTEAVHEVKDHLTRFVAQAPGPVGEEVWRDDLKAMHVTTRLDRLFEGWTEKSAGIARKRVDEKIKFILGEVNRYWAVPVLNEKLPGEDEAFVNQIAQEALARGSK